MVWGFGSFRQNLADFERALRRGEQTDRERAERAKKPSVVSRAARLRQEAAALRTDWNARSGKVSRCSSSRIAGVSLGPWATVRDARTA